MKKRFIFMMIAVSFILLLVSCDGEEDRLLKESYQPIYTESEHLLLVTPDQSMPPVYTLGSPTPSPLPMSSAIIVVPITPTPAPIPTNTASMYSSLADMVAFDPATGWAQFDYWERLAGDDAVDWLVSHEGYTRDEAQDYVAGWADTEYIKKNTNPQLRTIDLSAVPVWMLDWTNGYDIAPEAAVPVSFSDICALYSLNPYLVLTDPSFGLYYYQIRVSPDQWMTDPNNTIEVYQVWVP